MLLVAKCDNAHTKFPLWSAPDLMKGGKSQKASP